MSRCFIVLLSLVVLNSCTTTKGPAKGTAEWNYQKAKDSFRQGDWEKTGDLLDKVLSQSGPFQARAAAWRLILETGHIQGYQELAEAYDKGGPKKIDFMRQKNAQLNELRRAAIHLLETYPVFAKIVSEKPVELEFPFPEGSASPVSELERVYKGMPPVSEEGRAAMHEKVHQRGIIRAFSQAITGSPDDSPGAMAAMSSGKASVPSAIFLTAVADSMAKAAPLFDRKNLNEPDKMKMLNERAAEVAARALELKPPAAIEKTAKKAKANAEKALEAKKK